MAFFATKRVGKEEMALNLAKKDLSRLFYFHCTELAAIVRMVQGDFQDASKTRIATSRNFCTKVLWQKKRLHPSRLFPINKSFFLMIDSLFFSFPLSTVVLLPHTSDKSSFPCPSLCPNWA